VGDSISASLEYVSPARSLLSRRFRMHFDLEVCRRLVATSCAFQGRRPSSALQVITSLGSSVGDVVIVNVGYNEDSYGYRDGMRRVLHAARAQGARAIVWVTLRETSDVYRTTNAVIRDEAKRWAAVRVANWAALSRGRPWFREDGLHLNAAGAMGLARLLRANVLSAA
jgi:lysophospholipase L1-like esterase